MRLFLGVDGGQSSTAALIGDETGRVLGSGRGGPCNHVKGPEGRTKFVNAIRGCIAAACQEAGISAEGVSFESACLGFSGGPADKEAILKEMIRAETLIVTHDALIALAGATAGAPGIIAIGGTGSIAFGRNAAGRTARAGGWGYIFGDEGGGFDLTRQAVRAALRQEEGWGAPTALHQMLLEETGAADANEVLHRFYTTDYPRPRIAGYSRLVDQAAQEGDGVAQDILKAAGQHLAVFVGAVRSQLFAEAEPARVAWIGGVFRSDLLREQFRMLVELDEGNQAGPPEYEPAAGALLEAYSTAGLSPRLLSLPPSK